MTRRPTKKAKATPSQRSGAALAPLIAEVRGLIQSARHAAATAVNTLQVLTNFEIGRRIVEHEQKGAKRAAYGTELLKELSARLTEEFGSGFSERNLDYMRKFFLAWRERFPSISQTPSAKFAPIPISATPSRKSFNPFTLSWSHYVLLLTITNPDERSFYEIEAASENWSLRELKRQVASSLYERLALSRDKKGIRKLAAEGQIISKPEDVLKEPYTLEFLGLAEKASYSESDLEQAIIDRIEHFLLELGKGFLFEARQKRFTFDEDHFFVDLVFYNRLLRCYVLVDLKVDKLTHQDLGQMQMYVNYFDRRVKLPEENPTVGILLCKRKKEAIVELTLPKDANIHAREYKLLLAFKGIAQEKAPRMDPRPRTQRMNLETFFEKFDLFADAPNAVAKMRELVLELAVQGRLVERHPSDGCASEIFREVQLFEGDSRYEIPKSWIWVRFAAVGEQRLGKMLDQRKNRGELKPYLRNTNVQWMRFELDDIKELRLEPDELKEYSLQPGDLLICEGGEPGRCAIWKDSDREMYFQKAIHRVRPRKGILAEYLAICLRIDAQNGVLTNYFTGATIKHFTGRSLSEYSIPVPPLAEQKRIVAKVDELMALCDRLEAQQQERETRHTALARASLARFADAPTPANLEFIFHKSYDISPADLRKTILTLAVQGKLVPKTPTTSRPNGRYRS